MKKIYSKSLILLALFSLVISPLQVSALMMISDGDFGDTGGGTIFDTNTSLTFGLNKEIYSPGETVVVSGQASATYCTNSIGDLTVTANTNGSPSITLFTAHLAGAQSASGSGNLTAPMTPGNYVVTVSAVGIVTGQSGAGPSQPIGTSRSGTQDIAYTVAAATSPAADVWFSFNTLIDSLRGYFTKNTASHENILTRR